MITYIYCVSKECTYLKKKKKQVICCKEHFTTQNPNI